MPPCHSPHMHLPCARFQTQSQLSGLVGAHELQQFNGLRVLMQGCVQEPIESPFQTEYTAHTRNMRIYKKQISGKPERHLSLSPTLSPSLSLFSLSSQHSTPHTISTLPFLCFIPLLNINIHFSIITFFPTFFLSSSLSQLFHLFFTHMTL